MLGFCQITICQRGNGRIICNNFPIYKSRSSEWDPTPIINVNERLLQNNFSAEDLIFYTYAVLCSDNYLDEFEGALFTVSNSEKNPRIPIVESRDLFMNIRNLGMVLALLELNQDEANLIHYNYDINYNHGYLSRFSDIFSHDSNLLGDSINIARQEITLEFDDHDNIQLSPIDKDILEFKVSGYQVLDQWLKFHSNRYSRMVFSVTKFDEFLDLLDKIKVLIKIIQKINSYMEGILEGKMQLL